MGRRPATLSGKVLNCAIWLPDEYGGWKCGSYARVCKTDIKCAPLPDPKRKQVKVCTKTQKVFSLFWDKMITRCKTYAPTCTGRACMDSSMPYPGEPTEKTKPAPIEIKSIAQWMADEFNEDALNKVPFLAREILQRGGIRPQRGGKEKEEYKAIPLFMRNKTGLPLDEMADEMDYEDGSDLRRAISEAYPIKAKGEWKKWKRPKSANDFIDAAYEFIEDQMVEGQWL